MQARSFVGTVRRIEAYADATLALSEATSTPVWNNGWSLLRAVREFGELVRASAPLPYEQGADPAVNDVVADLLARLDGWSYLPAVGEDHPARQAGRADIVGDLTVIPLSQSGPGVHNWVVLVRFLDWKLARIAEKVRRVRRRLRQTGDVAPYAGVWESGLAMLEATQTVVRYLWRRRRTVAQRVPETRDEPERFGRWAIEEITER